MCKGPPEHMHGCNSASIQFHRELGTQKVGATREAGTQEPRTQVVRIIKNEGHMESDTQGVRNTGRQEQRE